MIDFEVVCHQVDFFVVAAAFIAGMMAGCIFLRFFDELHGIRYIHESELKQMRR